MQDYINPLRPVALARNPITRQVGYLPFNQAFEARLPYVENYFISADGSTGVTASGYSFWTNNLYDPRYETGGHQPLQYDTLTPLYERVFADKVDFEITFSNPSADGMYVGYRAVGFTNTVVTAGQSLEYIQEMGLTTIKPINNTGSQNVIFRGTVSTRQILGLTPAEYANLDYSHIVSGSPASGAFIVPFAVNTIDATTAAVRVNIKLVYHAKFTNLKTAAQS